MLARSQSETRKRRELENNGLAIIRPSLKDPSYTEIDTHKRDNAKPDITKSYKNEKQLLRALIWVYLWKKSIKKSHNTSKKKNLVHLQWWTRLLYKKVFCAKTGMQNTFYRDFKAIKCVYKILQNWVSLTLWLSVFELFSSFLKMYCNMLDIIMYLHVMSGFVWWCSRCKKLNLHQRHLLLTLPQLLIYCISIHFPAQLNHSNAHFLNWSKNKQRLLLLYCVCSSLDFCIFVCFFTSKFISTQ